MAKDSFRWRLGTITIDEKTRKSNPIKAMCFRRIRSQSISKKKSLNICIYLFLSAQERAEFNKSCSLIGSWSGRIFFIRTDRYSGQNPSGRSIFLNELAVIVNLSPFLHFQRRLINASLSLFTFRWQGKLL